MLKTGHFASAIAQVLVELCSSVDEMEDMVRSMYIVGCPRWKRMELRCEILCAISALYGETDRKLWQINTGGHVGGCVIEEVE